MTARIAYDLDKDLAGAEIAKANLHIRKRRSEASRKAAQWDVLLASDEFQDYLAESGLELRPKWPAIPCDVFTESATLGAIMLNGRAARKAVALLKPEHFWFPPHRHIFRACVLIEQDMRRGIRIRTDMVTVADKLRAYSKLEEIGGAMRLNQCLEDCPSATNIAAYISILHETARRRLLFQMCHLASGEALAPDASDTILIGQIRRGLNEIEAHSMCKVKTLFETPKQA